MRNLLMIAFVVAVAVPGVGQEAFDLGGRWNVRPERDGAPEVEIVVPGAWEEALGGDFDGVASYRRRLPLTEAHRGARLSVGFRAAATHATVFCNGQEIARHLGGWTPFRAELPAELKFDGSDVLEVRLDELLGHNTQGFLPIIQPHFGGIWQEVTLHVDRGPTIDRERLFVFGRGDGPLRAEVVVRDGPRPMSGLRVRVRVMTPGASGGESPAGEAAVQGGTARVEAKHGPVPTWSPESPRLLPVEVTLLSSAGEVLDTVRSDVALRHFEAKGRELFLNGEPLQLRGILHWGYSPPFFAPPTQRSFWERQLRDFKALGFNLVKCCLWVPPPVFYELCNELGLLVWQEYPTWHPKMDEAHREELRREYEEFFRLDRRFACVAIRSLTCETGHGAELHVLKELYEACHAAVPDTIVVDDSSWIGWQRVTDFWDEHPYGNNRWWPGRLGEFQRHIAEKGEKPLLLGECMAADTWADRAAWIERHGETPRFWRPDCFVDQARFEAWFEQRIGAAPLARLSKWSRDFGLRNRKFQIERLRATIPEAGYVVSVARDFGKARMGLYDDFDRLKWTPEDFAWHRDVMLSLMTEKDARAFAGPLRLPLVLSGFGGGKPAKIRCRLASGDRVIERVLEVPASTSRASAPVVAEFTPPAVAAPLAWSFEAEVVDLPSARNAWTLWQVPAPLPVDDATSRVSTRVTPELLDFVEAGSIGVLLAGGDTPTFTNEKLWFLRGAPFLARDAPFGIPGNFLLELFSFDLETERMLPWSVLGDDLTPALGFWETHDLAEVRAHWLLGSVRLGKGVLHVSSLEHGGDAGRWLLSVLRQEATRAAVPAGNPLRSAGLLDALRAELSGTFVDLPTWRFAVDPKNEGLKAGWMNPGFDDTEWRELAAGKHWENLGIEHYDGVAWYRRSIVGPEALRDHDVRLIFEGIDDSATVWLNGELIARFGDPETKTTVWLERSVAELGRRLRIGELNLIVARVVDHHGAGGLWKPVMLTTLPATRLLAR